MKKLILSSLCLAGVFTASAQSIERQVVASSGDYFTTGTISVSFTVGEMAAVTSFLTSTMHLTQGFQQPEAVFTGIKTNTVENSVFAVYPNPATELVTIRFEGLTDGKFNVDLYNVLGQLVIHKQFVSQPGLNEYAFDLAGISQGLYLIELSGTQNGKEFKKQEKLNVIY